MAIYNNYAFLPLDKFFFNCELLASTDLYEIYFNPKDNIIYKKPKIKDYEEALTKLKTEAFVYEKLQYIPNISSAKLTNQLNILKMPYLGITLRRFMENPLTITNVLEITRIFLSTVKAFYQKGIIHCDMKPDNIAIQIEEDKKASTIFNITVPYIFDFGIAIHCKPNEKFPIKYPKDACLQTSWYRSPQVIFEKALNPSIDLWSSGCIIYEMLTKKPLFLTSQGFYLEENLEVLRQIIQTIGHPKDDFLDSATIHINTFYFKKDGQYIPNQSFQNYLNNYPKRDIKNLIKQSLAIPLNAQNSSELKLLIELIKKFVSYDYDYNNLQNEIDLIDECLKKSQSKKEALKKEKIKASIIKRAKEKQIELTDKNLETLTTFFSTVKYFNGFEDLIDNMLSTYETNPTFESEESK